MYNCSRIRQARDSYNWFVLTFQADLGVLTKPDLVDADEHEGWLQILSNQTRKLHHGYYATRLPSSKERGKTWEAARQTEKNFFTSTAPWNGRNVEKRFGIPRLTEALSEILSQMITKMYFQKRIN